MAASQPLIGDDVLSPARSGPFKIGRAARRIFPAKASHSQPKSACHQFCELIVNWITHADPNPLHVAVHRMA
jgi:hypothetical protein